MVSLPPWLHYQCSHGTDCLARAPSCPLTQHNPHVHGPYHPPFLHHHPSCQLSELSQVCYLDIMPPYQLSTISFSWYCNFSNIYILYYHFTAWNILIPSYCIWCFQHWILTGLPGLERRASHTLTLLASLMAASSSSVLVSKRQTLLRLPWLCPVLRIRLYREHSLCQV